MTAHLAREFETFLDQVESLGERIARSEAEAAQVRGRLERRSDFHDWVPSRNIM